MKNKLVISLMAASIIAGSAFAEGIKIEQTKIVCPNGVDGFYIEVSKEGVSKKVTYDSCESGTLDIEEADFISTITDIPSIPSIVSASGHRTGYQSNIADFIVHDFSDNYNSVQNYTFSGILNEAHEQVIDVVSFDKPTHVGNFTTGAHINNKGEDYPTGMFNIYKSDDGVNWELAYANEEERYGEYTHEMDFVTSYLKLESIGSYDNGHWRLYGQNYYGDKPAGEDMTAIQTSNYEPWDIKEMTTED